MEKMNGILSICIPTYNRADKLALGLESIISQVHNKNIPIYISDNNSSDNTREVVSTMKQKYKYIFYTCNETNMGPDYNFEKVLKYSLSTYSWLLSDDDLIINDGIDLVLQSIISDHDLIIVNAKQGFNGAEAKTRVHHTPDFLYTDKNKLLIDLGWHATWMSCLIFSKKIIDNGNFKRYNNTLFIHFGTIFDYLGHQDKINVLWLNEPIVSYAKNSVAGYDESNYIDIFIKHWSNVVMLLPGSYTKEAKSLCIKKHAISLNTFNSRYFLSSRVKGNLNINIFKEYYPFLRVAATAPMPFIFTFCLLPRLLCKWVEISYSRLYKILHA